MQVCFVWHGLHFNKTCNGPFEPCHEKTCLCHMRTTKAQISLCICTVCVLISAFIVRCLDSIISTLLKSRFSTLSSFCNWPGWFESYLITYPQNIAKFGRYRLKLKQNALDAGMCKSNFPVAKFKLFVAKPKFWLIEKLPPIFTVVIGISFWL